MHFLILFLLVPALVFTNPQDLDAKIYVAGHTGLIGKAITSKLIEKGYTNIITRNSSELDLRNARKTKLFFEKVRPEYVYLAAGKVGGILANRDHPAECIYDNLAIELNVIDNAYKSGVKKLLFLGSSCTYPAICPQPIYEEYLLSGPLESTNRAYAVAKIAGIELCQAYRRQYGFNAIVCMPSNLYGPNDNFNLNTSHVLPALIRKCIEAKKNQYDSIEIWGTGSVLREFIYVDDLAQAMIFLMEHYNEEQIINVGTEEGISILDLARLIKDEVGFEGEITHDLKKPDGAPQKILSTHKLKKLGFTPQTPLREGIQETIKWYKENNK